MTFDFYIGKASFLHRLDPRVKIIATIAIMLVAFIHTTLMSTTILLLLLHVLFAAGRIPARRILFLWYFMLPITIMIILFWPLFDASGHVLFAAGPITITIEALLRGLAMALRMCNLAFAMFLLLFTTSQTKLIHGLVAMGLPYGAGLMLSIAFRYIPSFFNIYHMVCDAQRARGLNLKKGNFLKRLRSHIPILIAVIITGLKMVTNLSYALETRGFGMKNTQGKRTYYDELHMTFADKIILLAMLAITGVIIYF